VETLEANIIGVLAVSSGVGVAMVWLATRFSMLEQRQANRCPACGVIRRHGACSCLN
jgi:hypothetical protein